MSYNLSRLRSRDNAYSRVDMEKVMQLYHGTLSCYAENIINSGIDVYFSRKNIDFGHGFYLTNKEQTAREWARRRANYSSDEGVVLIYEISPKEMNTLCTTDVTSRSRAWKEEIIAHRIYRPQCSADVIIGEIADSKMNRLLKAFHKGIIDEDELFIRIEPLNEKGLQYTFKTSKAIKLLHYVGMKKVVVNGCY